MLSIGEVMCYINRRGPFFATQCISLAGVFCWPWKSWRWRSRWPNRCQTTMECHNVCL